MKNAVSWFEIPAANIDRAVKFYSTVLGVELHRTTMMGTELAFFPADPQGVGGAIACGADYAPAMSGTLVYLNAGPDLAPALDRIGSAGGSVIVPKTAIAPDMGFFALFIDTEGNKVALHSMA